MAIFKNCVILFLIAAFTVISYGQTEEPQPTPVPVEYIDSKADVPARTVFIELSKIALATSYDIQIKPFKNIWAKNFDFNTKIETIRVRLTPGHYGIRVRSRDAKNKPGPWRSWKKIWIHFQSLPNVYPANNTTIDPKSDQEERLIFEWPKVSTAKYYYFQLYDETGKSLRKIKTKQTWVPVHVKTKSSYRWTVNPQSSLDEPDVPEQYKVYYAFQVGAPNPNSRGVQLEVTKTRRALKYQFEVLKFLGDKETSEPSLLESREPFFNARLGPGDYEMRVRAVLEGGTKTEWSAPNQFFIPFGLPKLIGPLKNDVVEPTDDEESVVTLKWKDMKEPARYRVYVFREDGVVAATAETKDAFAEVKLPADSSYKWRVEAIHSREPDRAPASVKPEPGDGQFAIDPYVKLSLSKAEEPSQFYGVGRYLVANSEEIAKNYDNNTHIKQVLFAGTGELGLGYWHRKTNLGFLTNGAASGVLVEGKHLSYYSSNFLLGYRHKFKNSSRLRIFAGPAYKETPEVLVNPFSREIYFSKITNFGPEFRIYYINEFGERIGAHLYGSFYYSTVPLKTPGDQPQVSQLSYSFGVFGTYRLNETQLGMMGYTYQVDSAAYKSSDRTGFNNSVKLVGHYFSLSLIVGLDKAQK